MKNGAGRQAVSMEGRKTMILTKRQSKGLCRRRHDRAQLLTRAAFSRSERTAGQLGIVINGGGAIVFHEEVY
jgi:hypothetical protein